MMLIQLLLNFVFLFVSLAFLFLQIYYLVMFADLEADQIYPVEMCKKINLFVYPEIFGLATINAVVLLSGTFGTALLYMPLSIYGLYLAYTGKALFDATTVFKVVPNLRKIAFIKSVFFVGCFFFHTLLLIRALLGFDRLTWIF